MVQKDKDEIESWEDIIDRCTGGEGKEKGIGEKIREILDEGGVRGLDEEAGEKEERDGRWNKG